MLQIPVSINNFTLLLFQYKKKLLIHIHRDAYFLLIFAHVWSKICIFERLIFSQKFILEKSGRDRKSVIEGELSKIESAERESENSNWEIEPSEQ